MIIDHNSDSVALAKRQGQNRQMSMDDPNLFIGMYRDTIYKHKLRVIPQEYMANARDANREVGRGDVPIKVVLPTIFDPVLKITDCGPGINEERSVIFGLYGASTKRDSNDQNGGFGIGCKCAFSYTESFTVDTVYEEDGKKINRIYSVYIKNKTDPGNIRVVSEREVSSSIPTGTTVSIPIMSGDISSVERSVYTTAAWWDVKPEIEGDDSNSAEIDILESGDGWRRFGVTGTLCTIKSSGSIVVIDGMVYNLDLETLKKGVSQYEDLDDDTVEVRHHIEDKYISLLKHTRYALIFNTGDIEIAPDRENIVYSADTIDKIHEVTLKIYNKLVDEIKENIVKCTSLPELLTVAKPIIYFGSQVPDCLVYKDSNLINISRTCGKLKYQVLELNGLNVVNVDKTDLWNDIIPGTAVVFYDTERGWGSALDRLEDVHFRGFGCSRIIMVHTESLKYHRSDDDWAAAKRIIIDEFKTHDKLKRPSFGKRDKTRCDGITTFGNFNVTSLDDIPKDAIIIQKYFDNAVYPEGGGISKIHTLKKICNNPIFYANKTGQRYLNRSDREFTYLTKDMHIKIIKDELEKHKNKLRHLIAFNAADVDIVDHLDDIIDWCERNNKNRSIIVLRAYRTYTKKKFTDRDEELVEAAVQLGIVKKAKRLEREIRKVNDNLPFGHINVCCYSCYGSSRLDADKVMKNIIATYKEIN